jgi:hypothetical protein
LYTLIKNSTEYSEEYFEKIRKKQSAKNEIKLQKMAEQLGYALTKIAS